MKNKLYFEIFPEEQKRLFDTLSDLGWIKNFYLAGGTALALQIGHRQSIDFDFFTPENFNTGEIIHNLTDIGKFELFTESENTINGSLNNVRISFFRYKYPLIEKTYNIKNDYVLNSVKVIVLVLTQAINRSLNINFSLNRLLNL